MQQLGVDLDQQRRILATNMRQLERLLW